jgi:hypothetical protein
MYKWLKVTWVIFTKHLMIKFKKTIGKCANHLKNFFDHFEGISQNQSIQLSQFMAMVSVEKRFINCILTKQTFLQMT